MIQALVFYLFAALAVAGAVLVISARNPVHSVLFLILVFFNAAGLFLLLGAEFLAMVLVVVYVGAVAVLFLFVVMMLDISFSKLREGFLQYLPAGGLVGIVLLAELITALSAWKLAPDGAETLAAPVAKLGELDNTRLLGSLIYTDYAYLFQASGIILLIAMVGCIMLTLRHRDGVLKQKVAEQTARRPEQTVQIRKVNTGEGV